MSECYQKLFKKCKKGNTSYIIKAKNIEALVLYHLLDRKRKDG